MIGKTTLMYLTYFLLNTFLKFFLMKDLKYLLEYKTIEHVKKKTPRKKSNLRDKKKDNLV